jgi:hypothetical protein
MKIAPIMKGAFIACCLMGMLVLPVTAAPAKMSGNTTIDQGLKNDLWSAQGQHRLEVFDANVRQADTVTGILGNHAIDTSRCRQRWFR